MTGAVKGIIFDFGGVLMRTGMPYGRREWEERLGLPLGDLERVVHGSGIWVRAQRGQITYEDYWNGVADRLGINEADIPQLQHDYFRDDTLDPVLIALIRDLRTAGLKVGLLSNDSIMLETKLRDALHIYELFDAVVISAKIGIMKPDPGAYEAMLKALKLPADACVFIDDVQSNIDGAMMLGLHGILFRPSLNLRATLRDLTGISTL